MTVCCPFGLMFGTSANFGPTPDSDHFCSFCLSPIGRQIVRQSFVFQIRKLKMKSILKNSLLMLAVAVAFSATTVSAQTVLESVDDIPAAAAGTAQAFYDAATGDVFVSIGSDLSILGVQGAEFNLANNQSLPGFPPATSGELAFLFLPPLANVEIPTGIFNLGNILPADPSVVDLASFQASSFGGAEVQFTSANATGPQGFGVIAGSTIPEPGSLSLLGLAGLGLVARRRR